MKKWIFRLLGNDIVIENLNAILSHRHDSIIKIGYDSDDSHNTYFFKINRQSIEQDKNDKVISRAKGYLNMLNGYAAIVFGLNNIKERGRLKIDRYLYCDSDDCSRDRDWSSISDSHNEETIYDPYIEISSYVPSENISLLEKAYDNHDIKAILMLLGTDLSWIDLCSINDTIKFYSDKKNIADKVYCNMHADIKNLTGTANNFSVLGVLSRHGEKGWTTPSKIVTISEARNIVNRLVANYLLAAHKIKIKSETFSYSQQTVDWSKLAGITVSD